MRITLDPSSPVPAYAQIGQQISALAASGSLEVGTRLSTVRQLAKDLDTAPGTVARAHRELEDAGVVTTSGRRGTHVASRQTFPDPEVIRSAADHLALQAQRTGASLPEILTAVVDAFNTRASEAFSHPKRTS